MPTAIATAPVVAMKTPPSGSRSRRTPTRGSSQPIRSCRGSPKITLSPSARPIAPRIAVSPPDSTGPSIDRRAALGEGPRAARRSIDGPVLSGGLTAILGAIGLALGLSVIFGEPRQLRIGWLLPLVGVRLDLDPLGGVFIATTGAVAIAVGIYAVGYANREHWARFPLITLPLFVAGMLLVPAAGSVTTFLLAWELMAATSLILVLSEHRRDAVRTAGVFYAIMTQLGFVAILVALVVLSASGSGDAFTTIAANADSLTPGTRNAVFLLTVLGFGSKAGLLPLHAWLPKAHPEAPSPVSALMSAAMVNVGIYGIIRIDLQLLGPGPHWWGLTLMIFGAVSAVFGVLQASVSTDLKQLLAYSTTENMGLITLALGAASLLTSSSAPTVAAIALTAALLHLLSHAAGMTLAAAACVVFAVAPAFFSPTLQRVLAVLPTVGGDSAGPKIDTILSLPGVAGSISPGLLAVALIIAILLALALARWGRRHRPPLAVTPLWACGADSLSPRMQYTATSFAEPLQRVFDDILRPDTNVEVTHFAESQYLVERVTYRTLMADPVEQRFYLPVVRAVTTWAQLVRRAHTGSVHLYLAYGAAGLLIVLLVAR